MTRGAKYVTGDVTRGVRYVTGDVTRGAWRVACMCGMRRVAVVLEKYV